MVKLFFCAAAERYHVRFPEPIDQQHDLCDIQVDFVLGVAEEVTVDVYMQAAGWDDRERNRARYALQTLPRSVIERQLRDYRDAITLPDGWEDDTT